MRFRWFVHKSTFDTEQQAGHIGVEDICFILDRLRIHTRSSSFDFSNRPIYQGETSTSDSAGTWTVTINGITELYDGLTTKVKITTEQGEFYSTLDVNNLGANPVWFGYNVPLTSSTPLTSNQEVTLTYRTTAGISPIIIGGTSYTRGWVLSESLKTTIGEGLTINNGSLKPDFGNVNTGNTTKPVTGNAVYNAIPHTYIKTAAVSNTTLTLTTQSNNTVVYSHPTATATTIPAADGKVLSSVTVNELGHVTAITSKTLAAADIPSLSWNKITSNKPTTISGYGITDAYTKTQVDNEVMDANGLAMCMSLAHLSAVGTTTQTTNPEWKYVLLDNDNKVLCGINQDGTSYVYASIAEIMDCINSSYT
jgi:hypothetical protein